MRDREEKKEVFEKVTMAIQNLEEILRKYTVKSEIEDMIEVAKEKLDELYYEIEEMPDHLLEDEIIEQFKEHILPSVREQFEGDGIADKPARREAFNIFTDALCKDDVISEEMYDQICIPDELEED
jgi:hypothetical protein